MATEKRLKEIKIRLTEMEYKSLMERKTKARIAEWIRETVLGQKPKRHPKPIDPSLLFELNRIGVNLNQIARQCNSQKPSIDLISVLATLLNIEKKLDELRKEAL